MAKRQLSIDRQLASKKGNADGSKITFVSTRSGSAEIYVMNSNGTGVVQVTNNTVPDDYPCFNRVGTKIAFYSTRVGNGDIYEVNLDGSGEIRFTTAAGIDTKPCYSPDGRRIAFQSNRAGSFDVFFMNVDGTNQTRLTSSSAIDTLPCFSPDGTRLAFTSTRSGGDNEICLSTLTSELTSPIMMLTQNFNNDSMPSWGLGRIGGLGAPAGNIRSAASNIELSSASSDAKQGTVTLNFDGALDSGSASHAESYFVEIGGQAVAVELVAITGNSTVTLVLPGGSFESGDTVTVSWHGLHDEAGRAVAGKSGPIVAK